MGKQLMALLPATRLQSRSHVLTQAASYLAGPFGVVVGRSTMKRWLCVFVCMVTTAVLVKGDVDLKASTFINMLQRL